MASRDLKNNIQLAVGTAPHSPAATGTITGTVIDTAGFASTTFILQSGAQTTTDITVTPVVMEGAVTGTLTSAANADLVGTEAAAALDGTAGASSATMVGYIGALRYVRCDVIVTSAATGLYNVVCVQGSPMKAPQ